LFFALGNTFVWPQDYLIVQRQTKKMIALALKGKKSTKKSILFFGSLLSLFWIYGFLGNTDLAKENFLAENPIYSAEARLATCTNNIPNNDGSIVLTSVTFGDRVNYSIGNTYTGDPDYNNATVIGGIPFTIASGLPNPTVFTDYTVRVFNGDSGTYTDVVVRLYQKSCAVSCDCTDYLYVNDPTLDLTHKFAIEPDGTIGAEIGSPWMPTGNITNPHGVVGDVNGNLYIAQIDVTPTRLYQVDCDGTILSSDAIPNWNRTLNLVSDDNTIYSIGRNPGGGTYHIYAHDVCSGNLINSLELPGGTPGWGLTKGEDGELYFTMSFAGITSPHRLYHVDKNLTTTTLIWSIPQISGYNTHGVTQDEFGNFYIVLTRNSPGATTLYKINSAGTIINTISDNALDGTGFGGTWGIVYNRFTGKLYMGTLGDDCVAVVDAGGQFGNMAYESTSGVGHVPGTYSKAINIVRECCPGSVNINLDTVICGVPFNTEIFLADIISCDEGVFCEGVWAADPGNGGITYDPCNQTIAFNNASACGEFSLTSGGGGQCGTFNFNVNIAYGEVIAPMVAGDQTLCKGEDPAPFTVTTPGSGNNTLQYQWQRSFTDCNSGFSSIPGATSDTYDPPAGIDTTTYYRLITLVDATGCTSGTCLDTSNCITVFVREITDPGITGLACNDNLTPTDGSDDFIEFSLNPQGHNNGATYSLTVNNGGTINLSGGFPATNIPFGAATSFEMQNGSADGTVYDITITDDSNPGCPFVFQISQSACSNDNVDLALIKVESSTGPYLPGDDVSFDITVYNQGTLPVTNVVVEDYLPSGMIFNQADNSDFTISGGEITTTIASLAAGASLTRSIVLQIDPTFTGNSITNNAEIKSYTGFDDEDSNPGNNNMSAPESGSDNDIDDEAPGTPGTTDNPADEDDFDPATISVLQSFDLALIKTLVGSGPYSTGDDVFFEITVYNQGLITATNVQITDYIPSDMLFNQGDNPDFTSSGANAVATIPSLAAGASTTLEITLQIDPAFTGTSIINNAEITAATGGTDEDSSPGNNSMSAAETSTDNDIDDEAPGTPGTADNPLDEDDFDPAAVSVFQSFDLALQKVLVTPGSYDAGDDVVFEITIYNQGTLEATNVQIIDYIPSDLIFNQGDNPDFTANGANAVATIPSLAAGASTTLEITLQIDPTFTGTSIINNAEITAATGGTDEDSTPGNNSMSAPETGTDNDINDEAPGTPGTADNPLDEDDFDPAEVSVFQSFDLALQKIIQTPGTYDAGDDVVFEITIYNQGTLEATNIEITDYIPSDMLFNQGDNPDFTANGANAVATIPSLAAGASTTLEITLQIDPTFTGTSIINNAEITAVTGGTDEDSTPGNNSMSAAETGTDNDIDDEAPGTPGTADNPLDEDDFDPAEVSVFQSFDLALQKVLVTPGTYDAGDDVVFEITVFNQGTLEATNVQVTDYIPTDMIFNQGDNPDFTASGANAVATIPSLAAGASTTLEITLQIDPAFTGTSITNNAEITAATGGADEDSSPGNNSMSAAETGTDNDIDDEAPGTPGTADNPLDEDDFDPAEVSVFQSFDLALQKVLVTPGSYDAGDDVVFEITIYNQGTLEATNIEITDYIPSDMIFNQGDNPDFTASGANAVATIPSLAAGASTTLEITLQIDPAFTGTSIINNAEITAATGGIDEDSSPGNNSMSAAETGTDNDINDEAPGTPGTADNPLDEDDFDPAEVSVFQSFDLALQKVLVAPGPYLPGENVAFEITVFNQGTLEATSVEVTDYIPTGFLFNLADNSEFTPSGSNAIANIPSLLAGASVTLEIVLQIDPLYDSPSIINNAEITNANGGTDEDSTPGDNSGTSPELGTDNDVNDESTGGADNPLDEDDFDPAEVSIYIPSDYGDLPDTYQTSSAANGPNHTLSQTLYLGTYVDAENDGQPEAMSGRMMDGDDAGTAIFSYGSNMDNDDEDGVRLLTPLVPGNTACMEVTTHYDDGGSGDKAYLTGWADWNGNGQFDSGEQLLFDQMIPSTTDAEVSPGDLTLPYCFEVPAGASFLDGNVFMRFRVSTVQGLDFFGAAPDGEVEDYKFPLAKVGNYVWEDTNLDGIQNEAGTGINGVLVQLTWAGVDGDLNTIGDNLQYLVNTANMSGVPGAYMFAGLIEGTYEISVPTAPAGLVTTIIDEPGATDFTDSDDPSGVSFTISDVENLVLNENGVTDIPGASGFPDNQEDISFDFGYFGACSLQITNMVASDCSQNRFELQITVEYENLQGDIEVQVNGRPYRFSKSGVTGSQTFTIPKLTCGPNYTVNVYVESVNDPACNGGLFSSFTTPCPDNNCLPVNLLKN
jgi:uncharacterized repeat protein (TIGR01451 family)